MMSVACPARGPSNSRTVLGGRFEVGMRLGAGGFANVYFGTEVAEPRRGVAVKIFDPSKPTGVEKYEREVGALQRIDSPHVVKMIRAGQCPVESERSPGLASVKPVMAMEFLLAHELYEYIVHAGANRLSGPVGRRIFWQAAAGVQACHAVNVAHRDLKPDNFMVQHRDYNLKLIDFNCAFVGAEPDKVVPVAQMPATPLPQDEDGKMEDEGEEAGAVGAAGEGAAEAPVGWTGTVNFGGGNYRPPEFFTSAGMGYEPFKADVWIMGILFLNIMTGLPPMAAARAGDVQFDRIVAGNWDAFWAHLDGQSRRYFRANCPLTPACKAFAQFMLRPIPADRPSMAEVLAHEWMRGPVADSASFATRLSGIADAIKAAKARQTHLEMQKLARFVRTRPAGGGFGAGQLREADDGAAPSHVAKEVPPRMEQPAARLMAFGTAGLVEAAVHQTLVELGQQGALPGAVEVSRLEDADLEAKVGAGQEQPKFTTLVVKVNLPVEEVEEPVGEGAVASGPSAVFTIRTFGVQPKRLKKLVLQASRDDPSSKEDLEALKSLASNVFEVIFMRGEASEGVEGLRVVQQVAAAMSDPLADRLAVLTAPAAAEA